MAFGKKKGAPVGNRNAAGKGGGRRSGGLTGKNAKVHAFAKTAPRIPIFKTAIGIGTASGLASAAPIAALGVGAATVGFAGYKFARHISARKAAGLTRKDVVNYNKFAGRKLAGIAKTKSGSVARTRAVTSYNRMFA